MEPQLLQRRPHLVMAEQEDVLLVRQEPVARQECPELAHLVPEDRHVAMVDVEVVVLDIGEDHAGEREALVESAAHLGREQRPVLTGDALPLCEHCLPRS